MIATAPMPVAFLGMAEGFKVRTARICMRCPDRMEAEAIALANDCDMTHGLCPDCGRAMLADLESIPVNK